MKFIETSILVNLVRGHREFQDFSISQILCEINFWDSRSSKTAVFAIFAKDCEFCSFGKFQPLKIARIHENQNSEPLNVLKWLI